MTIRMTAGVLWLASATAIVVAQGGDGAAPDAGIATPRAAVASRVAFVYPSAFPLRGAVSCRR
ncbi:MAG TPA: hypothetical protein VLF18_19375 [Tahibacter sp.]|uniref:hypothetical protein n=1 Tax=Tahibacter sp. TaxID=2056211 RepID=UPI002C656E1D|nr:hypothetical protein [Tahibacter sp.]HSX62351.1 hypothetical protein [Tahibacter sp.]